MKLVVNGRFLTRKITGVERFAYEMVLEFDKRVKKGEMVLAVPNAETMSINLKNIEIQTIGRLQGNLWEQIDLPMFIIKNKAVGINLCNVAPLIKPDFVCIHDMNIRVNPTNFRKIFVWWYRIQYSLNCNRAKKIITVSNFSKEEIEKYYPSASGKIMVVGNGWQHMQRVKEDEGIFERIHMDKEQKYFFAMSSMAPNKNLPWILRAAQKYPNKKFVIAGKVDMKVFESVEKKCLENVIYLGYITDEEAKALMRHCEAFLFPSFYEGFGIPPLEALSLGTNIVCSDIQIFHEIYGSVACYVDPCGDGDIRNLEFSQENERLNILNKYSYCESADILYKCLTQEN